METPLIATYFPFTHVSPFLPEALSFLLDRLVLYRPAGMAQMSSHPCWSERVDESFAEIRTFHAEPTVASHVIAEFEGWKAWGQMHRGEDLGYFKHMQGSLAPAGPFIPRVVSEIKDKTNAKPSEGDVGFACQLFLHLAHDFDQQSLEMEMQLARVKEQREAMLSFLRNDGPGDEAGPLPGDPFGETPQDRGQFMTANRLAAWGHLFGLEEDRHDLLVTDSPAVYQFFLDKTNDAVEMTSFTLGRADGFGSQDAAGNGLLRELIRPLFSTLLHKPFTEAVEEKTKITLDRVGGLAEGKGERSEGTKNGRHGSFSYQWHLIPGRDGKRLFDEKSDISRGKERSSTSSTLVGLIEHHEPN